MIKNYKTAMFCGLLSVMTAGAFAQQTPEKTSVKASSGILKVDPVKGAPLQGKAVLQNSMKLAPQNDFQLKKQETDQLGMTHQRFQQTYKGVKVEFATPIIHSKEGTTQSISGEFYDIKNLSVDAQISASAAFAKALQYTGAQSYMWQDAVTSQKMGYAQPQGELVILPAYEGRELVMKLAYKFDIYATQPVSRGNMYIDATDGSELFYDATIKHFDNFGHVGTPEATAITEADYCAALEAEDYTAIVAGQAATRYSGTQTIQTRIINGNYTLRDNTRGGGVNTYNSGGQNSYPQTNFTDADNNWTAAEFNNAAKDNAALDAHWGAEVTYDYWTAVHSRNSFDGSGAAINSWVHYDNQPGGAGYDNAFWNGSVMTYGDGSSNGAEGNGFFDALTSLDVAAHEVGHAVTTFTANLAYRRESGGLNEGFSDIWGAAVEHFAKGNGSDTNPSAEIWLIGDEIDRRNGSAALRSMSNPTSLGQPDTYGGQFWQEPNCGTPTQSNDYCGVHTNSGVLNYWFYLTVVGGSGSNDVGDVFSVSGIGMTKAAKISYRGLSQYLSANSTFANARTAMIQSAIDLYGAGGAEEEAVTNAMHAINVGDAFGGNTGGGTYCTSQGTNVNDEFIGRVQLGTIDNTSGSGNGYTDHTAIATDLVKGDAATITITPTWTGTVYAEGYAVWIDYNQNQSFDDAGELVYSRAASTTTPVSGTFTVPTGATDGETRMRVSMMYNDIPTSCETFTYGEVEDYTVNIGGSTADTQAPSVPANLSASNTTETTTDLSWSASSDNVGVTGYDVYQGTALLGTVTATSASITGLVEGTTYTFSVRAKDAAGNVSAASNSVTVTTETTNTADTQAPTIPANLSVGTVTDTEIGLSWTASSDNVGVTGYDVYQGTSLLGTATGTSANITGLTAGTSYSFSVRAKDAAGNVSNASNTVTATTTGGGSGPVSDLLLGSFFETGLDGWLDGGSDCFRYSGTRSFEGNRSMRLRDNSGTGSSMTTASGYNLTAYDNVEVSFSFYPNSMENGEDFFVRYNSGSGWQTVASFARGTDFNNGTFYTTTVNVPASQYNLSSNGRFRIQCDASANGDQVYIDAVTITGTSGAGIVPNSMIENGANQGIAGAMADSEDTFGFEGDFAMFPNPAIDYTEINLGLDIEDEAVQVTLDIYDVQGRVVLSKSYSDVTDEQMTENLDVSKLRSGVYFIKVSTSSGMLETQKLIKR